MTVAPERLYVDVEGPVKTWLRAQTYLTDVLTSKNGAPGIYLSTPKNSQTPDKPWLVFQSVNDLPEPGGGAPLVRALLQFDVYGPKRELVADAAAALVSVCESMRDGTPLDSTLIGHGAYVGRNQWLPDPDNALPRRSLDITFLVHAVTDGT
jgi:hypothetical protein